MDWSIRNRCGVPFSAMLRAHELPPEEIHAILKAVDPEVVRRYLELHRERLRERLDERLRALDVLDELLVAEEGRAATRADPYPLRRSRRGRTMRFVRQQRAERLLLVLMLVATTLLLAGCPKGGY